MTHRSIVVVSGGLRSPSSTRLLADQLGEATRAALVAASGASPVAASPVAASPVAASPVAASGASPVAASGASPGDVSVRHVELREHAHAIADALLTGFPTGGVKDALSDVAAADALVVVTPVFQASYGGLFKSFVDLVEAGSIRGVPVLLAATGGTERHSLVIEHALRPLFSYLGALTVPTGVYAATADFGGSGSAELAARIERAALELASLVVGRAPRRAREPALTPFADLLAGVARPEPGAS